MPKSIPRSSVARDRIRRILDDLIRSGLSVRAFCDARGLDRSSVYRWRRELGGEARPSAPTPLFVEIAPCPPPAAPQLPLEVIVGPGRRIRVAGAFDEAVLVRLVRILEVP